MAQSDYNFDTYALYPEGSYLVVSGSHREETEKVTDKILEYYGIVPPAVATLTRGVHTLKGETFSVYDLINKYGKKS